MTVIWEAKQPGSNVLELIESSSQLFHKFMYLCLLSYQSSLDIY